MKGLGFKNISQKESVLNVNFENEPNIRLTIHGDDKINEYCNTNNIKNRNIYCIYFQYIYEYK